MGSTKVKLRIVGAGRPKYWTADKLEALADELIDWINEPQNFWLMDFASERLIWEGHFSEWAAENDKFGCAYKIAKQIQTTKIMKGCLAGKFNPAMAIFALKNVSRWTDRVDVSAVPTKTIINVIQNHVPKPPEAIGNGNGHHNGNGANGNGSDAIPDAETNPSEDDA